MSAVFGPQLVVFGSCRKSMLETCKITEKNMYVGRLRKMKGAKLVRSAFISNQII